MNKPSPVTEDRIRERAYLLWLDEGQPQGKDAEHWEKARELLALEAGNGKGGSDDAAPGYSQPPRGAAPENVMPSTPQSTPRKRAANPRKRPM